MSQKIEAPRLEEDGALGSKIRAGTSKCNSSIPDAPPELQVLSLSDLLDMRRKKRQRRTRSMGRWQRHENFLVFRNLMGSSTRFVRGRLVGDCPICSTQHPGSNAVVDMDSGIFSCSKCHASYDRFELICRVFSCANEAELYAAEHVIVQQEYARRGVR